MLLPKAVAAVSRGNYASRAGFLAGESADILPSALPRECVGVASYSTCWCRGFFVGVQLCKDCCRLPNPYSPATYDEHCGVPYVSGPCIGFGW